MNYEYLKCLIREEFDLEILLKYRELQLIFEEKEKNEYISNTLREIILNGNTEFVQF